MPNIFPKITPSKNHSTNYTLRQIFCKNKCFLVELYKHVVTWSTKTKKVEQFKDKRHFQIFTVEEKTNSLPVV